jgi:hypothetical protein
MVDALLILLIFALMAIALLWIGVRKSPPSSQVELNLNPLSGRFYLKVTPVCSKCGQKPCRCNLIATENNDDKQD